jgi:hypothetical protein
LAVSGLFNGLRRIQIKNFFSGFPRVTGCGQSLQAAHSRRPARARPLVTGRGFSLEHYSNDFCLIQEKWLSCSACSWSQTLSSWPGLSRLSTPATLQRWGRHGRPAAATKLSLLPRSRIFDAPNHVDSRDKPGHDAASSCGDPLTPRFRRPTANAKSQKNGKFENDLVPREPQATLPVAPLRVSKGGSPFWPPSLEGSGVLRRSQS